MRHAKGHQIASGPVGIRHSTDVDDMADDIEITFLQVDSLLSGAAPFEAQFIISFDPERSCCPGARL
jgi:hypothetical protein